MRSPELPSAIALSGEIQHWLKIAPSQLPAASINETYCVLDLLTLSTVQTGNARSFIVHKEEGLKILLSELLQEH